MPSTPSAAVQHAQSMIQDYNQALQPLIADTLQNCFVAVQKHPRHSKATELVTLNANNGLMWLFPDTTSPTGWGHSPSDIFGAPFNSTTGLPQNPSRLMPFYQRDVLYVFSEFGSGTSSQLIGMQWTADKQWAGADISPQAEQLLAKMGQSNLLVDAEGRGYLYGASYANTQGGPVLIVLGVDPNGRGLTPIFEASFQYLNAPADAQFALLPGPDKDDFILLTLAGTTATFQALALQDGQLNLSGPASAPQPLDIPGPLQVDSVVPVPNGVTALPTFLLLSQQDQQLYAVSGNGLNNGAAATARALTGGTNQPVSVSSVSAGMEAGGTFAIFAIDATTSQLWTVTQPSGAGANPWVLLGNNVIAMTAPIAMDGGSEVLLCSPSTVISRLAQSLGTASWFQLPILAPAPPQQPIAETATYTQQFSFVDSTTGVPMPHTSVQVKCNPQQVVIINSIAYHASPDQAVTVLTDAFGNVTVATIANGLASPVLTLSSTVFGAAPQQQYRGDLQVHQRIAGQANGQAPLQVTGPWLIQNGVLPASTSSDDAANFASTMTSLSGCAVSMANSGGSTAQAAAPWTVVIGVNQSQLTCQQVTQEEFARFRSAADSVIGDVWGDVANFCKNVWHDVENIAVNIAEDTAEIVVKLFNATKHFVLTTIEDIRDALEAMIAFIAKLAEDAFKLIKLFIDLIKLLFNWGNILDVKNAIESYVNQLVTSLQGDATAATTWINAQFSTINSDVSSFFQNLETSIDPNLTFGSATASSSAPTSQIQPTMQANLVQSSYVWSKSLQVAPTSTSSALTDPVLGADAAMQAILQAFEYAFSANQQLLEDDWTQIGELAKQIDSISSFMDFLIVTFLDACAAFIELVISLIQYFIDKVLAQLAAAAQFIAEKMNHTIDVPVVTALYKLITKGHAMTLLDMLCLAVAIPTVVIYDVLNPNSTTAPFDGGNPPAVLWPWQPGFDASAPASAADLLTGAQDQEYLSIGAAVCSVLYALCDVGCDIANVAIQEKGGVDKDNKLLLGLLSGLTTLLNTAVVATGAPYFAPPASKSMAARWQWGTFSASVVGLCCDWVFICSTGKLLRFTNKAGPAISTVVGAFQVAMGCATAPIMAHHSGGYSYSGWDMAAGVLSGVSNLGKSFAYLPELIGPEAGYPAAYVALGCFDIAGDAGSMITNLFASYD